METESRKRHWVSVIGKWQESRTDIREFCRQEGISHSSMYYWRKKLGLLGKRISAPFIPVEIEHASESRLPDARWFGEFVGSILRGMK